jgi:hypothetical protein
MAVGDYELIGRAAEMLRVAPEPGWRAIEADVVAAVRATPRGGWPLVVEDPDPYGLPGIIRVSDLVVTNLLSRVLTGDPDYAVVDLRADSDDGVLQGVSVDLSCRYLVDVNAVAQRVRTRCAEVIGRVVGTNIAPPITVRVIDVHR